MMNQILKTEKTDLTILVEGESGRDYTEIVIKELTVQRR
jgi:hypothetical protein